MNLKKTAKVFTSESVSEGHPDKVCDQISDAVLDACLAQDPKSHVACETLAASDLVVNAGEITCSGWEQIDPESLARKVVDEIGYNRSELGFAAETFQYISRLHPQSPDIAQGVNEKTSQSKDQGAGDQGIMFGYATSDTREMLPPSIAFSNHLMRALRDIRKKGELDYLRPDAKAQVSVRYKNGKANEIVSVVISHQTDDVPSERIKTDLEEIARNTLNREDNNLITNSTQFYINPTGKFTIGGPYGDAGLTGRKIIVDTYGGVGSHGGGAFSGKDPSKVDRSAAYYSRYVAKNIVAANLADSCEIQVAYAIGMAQPLAISVDTYDTARMVEDSELEKMIRLAGIFDFRPRRMIEDLELLSPLGWSYRDTAAYGHFGRSLFPWEKTDKVNELRDWFNLST